jgi:hypothetical protein
MRLIVQVKTLSSQEVVFAIERGVPIIDVRPADLYAKVRLHVQYRVFVTTAAKQMVTNKTSNI